jgi:gliding motility-associated protein GldM
MAGGKQSPRQKMISLMYLVFIAMLALNMSKEVLNAFGLLNVSLEEGNTSATLKNADAMAGLNLLASDQPVKYAPLKKQAEEVNNASNDYFNYLNGIKEGMKASVEDDTDYQVMDKGDFLDELFFKGDNLSPEGEKFISNMNTYRDEMISIVGATSTSANQLNKDFTPDPVENRDDIDVPYMDYNFKGYPLIASIAKITLLQSEVKSVQSDVLGNLLSGTLKSEVSMTNYTTLMETPKSAYYNGEMFDGNIVLGRKDATLQPKRVELSLDGRKLTAGEYEVKEGRVLLKVSAGSPGDHKITGNLIFDQDGKELEVKVEQSFATIPKPDAATIAADKMNVVYIGVDNPMTISFAGISGNNVNATAPGLSKVTGDSYIMKPRGGKEVKINVTGKLPDGTSVSDNATFRIKSLPRPTGMVSGQYENVKKTRSSLGISTISAEFLDFDFKLTPQVKSFLFQVPGKPSITVTGNKLNDQAKSLLSQARRGDLVQIANIQAVVPGVNVKSVSAVIIELTD